MTLRIWDDSRTALITLLWTPFLYATLNQFPLAACMYMPSLPWRIKHSHDFLVHFVRDHINSLFHFARVILDIFDVYPSMINFSSILICTCYLLFISAFALASTIASAIISIPITRSTVRAMVIPMVPVPQQRSSKVVFLFSSMLHHSAHLVYSSSVAGVLT